MMILRPGWYDRYVNLCEASGQVPTALSQLLTHPLIIDLTDVPDGDVDVRQVFIAAHGVEPFQPLETEEPQPYLGKDISDVSQLSHDEQRALSIARSIPDPRVDERLILSRVALVTYTQLPEGRTIVCEVTMVNGATFTGSYTAPHHGVYSEEAGKAVARAGAYSKATICELYRLREEAYRMKNSTVDAKALSHGR